MKKIAIVVVAYNRTESLKRLLDSLSKAVYPDDVCLIFSIDKSDVTEVSDIAASYSWTHGEKRIIQHAKRLGLRNHILSVGNLLQEFDAIIVLEDDIVVAKNFYLYSKVCVERFENADEIAGISLYNFSINYQTGKEFHPIKNDCDVYFMQTAQSWGQVWMKRQWKHFTDWYATHQADFTYMPHIPKTICHWPNSSWLKYHTRYCIETNKYFVYPYQSYSSNCGDCGSHYTYSSPLFRTILASETWAEPTFPESPQKGITYDAFFENRNLSLSLGLPEKDLCIDLNRQKQHNDQRYWLTTARANYKILKHFGLYRKPIDTNIIENIKGNGIYLYDTSIYEKNTIDTKRELFEYEQHSDVLYLLKSIRLYGIGAILRLYLSNIFAKFKHS